MIEIIPNWHPVFVHYTIALLSVSVVMFITSRVSQTGHGAMLLTFARWNLWIGVCISLLTAGAGVYAYNTVAHDTPSHAAMTDHRNWAIATLVVFAVLAVWSYITRSETQKISAGFLAVALVGLVLLATTGYKGAETVFRHGLGVMSLPKAEGDGHAHEHPDGASHGHEETRTQADTPEPDVDKKTSKPVISDIVNGAPPRGHHDDGHDHAH